MEDISDYPILEKWVEMYSYSEENSESVIAVCDLEPKLVALVSEVKTLKEKEQRLIELVHHLNDSSTCYIYNIRLDDLFQEITGTIT